MLEKIKLMAIIRDVRPDWALEIVRALAEEGITDFEFSLSDPDPGLEGIRMAMERYAGQGIHIGAGTVSTKEEIDRLADMKVPYILTPGFDREIVSYAKKRGLEILPGVLTPTDVQMAVNCGITLMKLFPADAFGANYVKSLKGPFPRTDYMAVGGVDLDTAASFFQNGFAGIAVGSSLVPRKATLDDLGKIRRAGRKYVEIVCAAGRKG